MYKLLDSDLTWHGPQSTTTTVLDTECFNWQTFTLHYFLYIHWFRINFELILMMQSKLWYYFHSIKQQHLSYNGQTSILTGHSLSLPLDNFSTACHCHSVRAITQCQSLNPRKLNPTSLTPRAQASNTILLRTVRRLHWVRIHMAKIIVKTTQRSLTLWTLTVSMCRTRTDG